MTIVVNFYITVYITLVRLIPCIHRPPRSSTPNALTSIKWSLTLQSKNSDSRNVSSQANTLYTLTSRMNITYIITSTPHNHLISLSLKRITKNNIEHFDTNIIQFSAHPIQICWLCKPVRAGRWCRLDWRWRRSVGSRVVGGAKGGTTSDRATYSIRARILNSITSVWKVSIFSYFVKRPY